MADEITSMLSEFGVQPDEGRAFNARFAVEFVPEAFQQYFAALGKDPDNPELLEEMRALNALSQEPSVRGKRAQLAMAVKQHLPPISSEVGLIDESQNVVSAEDFIRAEKPILIIGGLGRFWENSTTNSTTNSSSSNEPVFHRKIMRDTAKSIFDNGRTPKEEIPKILLLLYPAGQNSIELRSADLLLHHADPNYVGNEAEYIAKTYILPRIMAAAKKDEKGEYLRNEEGAVVFDDELLQRQSRFTMQRMCYGDAMGKQVDCCVARELREAGVSQDHVRRIQDQMFVFSLLGVGGVNQEPIKTIGIRHQLDVYAARFGAMGTVHPQHISIDTHAPEPNGKFHNVPCLDKRYLDYPHLLTNALIRGVTSDVLPDVRELYNPSRFHSEIQENPAIRAAATSGELAEIRGFTQNIERQAIVRK